MFVYQFLGPVATAFFVVGYYRVWDPRLVLRPLIVGIAAYLPTWLLVLVLEAVGTEALYGIALFLDALLMQHALVILFGIALFYMLAGELRSALEAPFLTGMSSFLAGFFTAEAMLYMALGPDVATPYDLFVLPTMRMLAVVVVPLIIWAFRRAGGVDRYIWLAVALVTVGLFSLVTFLDGINYHVVAYAFVGVMVAVVVALHVLIAGARSGGYAS